LGVAEVGGRTWGRCFFVGHKFFGFKSKAHPSRKDRDLEWSTLQSDFEDKKGAAFGCASYFLSTYILPDWWVNWDMGRSLYLSLNDEDRRNWGVWGLDKKLVKLRLWKN